MTIESSIGDAVRFGISESWAETDRDGWIIPEEPRPWMHYAFYGCDVRIQSVPFIQHQMELIAQIETVDENGDVEHPKGIFHIGSQDKMFVPSQVWKLEGGGLTVHGKPPAV